VEHSASRGTSTHADAPLGLRHLEPDPLQDWHHFHRNAARNDHQVALTRTESHDLGAKPCDVEPACPYSHQLDSAACRGKRHWPEAVLATPVRDRIAPGDKRVVGYREVTPALDRQLRAYLRTLPRGDRRRILAYRHSKTPFRRAYA